MAKWFKEPEDGAEETKQPDEWAEIQALETEIREENTQLQPLKVERRAPARPAPQSNTVVADQLGVPKFCDQCYLIDKCPHYKQGATCYFQNRVRVTGPQDLLELMRMMLEIQGERVLFGRFIEQSEGGYPDANLSKEMKMLMDLMKDFKEMLSTDQDEISIRIKGSGATRAVAQEESRSAGGILSQIFGGGGKNDGHTEPNEGED